MEPYYEDDGIVIYHGDCREVLPDLLKVDLVLTDPPYGINYKSATWEDSPEQYAELMRWLVAECNRVVTDGWVFIFQAMRNAPRYHEWFPSQYRIFAAIKNFAQVTPTRIRHSWDPVVFWHQGEKGKPEQGKVNRDYHIGDTARMVLEKHSVRHPCPRPLDTMKYLVDIASNDGQTVLDPFMGSGTTIRAAKDLGRKAIGIELEEKYCEIAANRMRQKVLFA